jgi:hypothetical protein
MQEISPSHESDKSQKLNKLTEIAREILLLLAKNQGVGEEEISPKTFEKVFVFSSIRELFGFLKERDIKISGSHKLQSVLRVAMLGAFIGTFDDTHVVYVHPVYKNISSIVNYRMILHELQHVMDRIFPITQDESTVENKTNELLLGFAILVAIAIIKTLLSASGYESSETRAVLGILLVVTSLSNLYFAKQSIKFHRLDKEEIRARKTARLVSNKSFATALEKLKKD